MRCIWDEWLKIYTRYHGRFAIAIGSIQSNSLCVPHSHLPFLTSRNMRPVTHPGTEKHNVPPMSTLAFLTQKLSSHHPGAPTTKQCGLYMHFSEAATPVAKHPTPKARMKRKKALTYCQQLVQRMARSEFDIRKKQPASQGSSTLTPVPSRLLALPPEIRQHVLYQLLDDEHIVHNPIRKQSRRLESMHNPQG